MPQPPRFLPILASFALAFAICLLCGRAQAQKELGLNIHQSIDLGPPITQEAGLKWVRIDLNWFNAQPTNGPCDFTLFDTLVDAALARNLQVLAVVGYSPAWASSGDTHSDGSHNDVPVPGTYAPFVTAVVEHFAGRVTHYELWNEPNLDEFFEGDRDDYTSLILVPGADAVHAACPTCQVVAPGLASINEEYDLWLDAALSAAKDRIDIVSGHIYAGFHPNQTSDNFYNKLDQHRVVEVGGTVVYVGPLSFHEVMVQHGVTAPFWLTETGRQAPADDDEKLAEQEEYYRKVLETMLPRPWWTNTIFYEAFDNTDLHWGVATPSAPLPTSDYTPKPVMSLLQKVTSSQPAFGGTGTDCDDGLDNEGDGLVDYPDDPDCASAQGDSEGEPPPDAGVGGGGGAGGGVMGGAAPSPAADGSDDDGCGCRVAGAATQSGAHRADWLLLLAMLVGGVGRRWREGRQGAPGARDRRGGRAT